MDILTGIVDLIAKGNIEVILLGLVFFIFWKFAEIAVQWVSHKILGKEKTSLEVVESVVCALTNEDILNNDNLVMEDLLRTPFFHDLAHLVNRRIDQMDLGDEGRNLIFKDFLKFKLGAFKEEYSKLHQYRIDSPLDLYEVNMVVFSNALDKYTNDAKLAGIPMVVINKFEDYHNPRIEMSMEQIGAICNDPIFHSLVERQHAIYILLQSALYLTVIDASITLRTLNGALTGAEYKGVVIGDLH